jgi:RNA polymerase sigma factor (sigma-70 family)
MRAAPPLAPPLLFAGVMNTSGRTTETLQSYDEAMARYAGGDDGAFPEVYAAIAPRLARFYGRRLRDKATVSDLVQETLLRIHSARARFVAGSPVMPWVLTIAGRLFVDRVRNARREQLTELDRLEGFTGMWMISKLPSGEEILMAKETAGCVDRALAGISEPQRAALRLVKGQGLSVTQAAAALRTTTTGVRLRTHRALRAVRAELALEGRAAA